MKTCKDCQNFPEEPNQALSPGGNAAGSEAEVKSDYICRRKLIPRDKESPACTNFREKEKKGENGYAGKRGKRN